MEQEITNLGKVIDEIKGMIDSGKLSVEQQHKLEEALAALERQRDAYKEAIREMQKGQIDAARRDVFGPPSIDY